jgi:hypothetical protein
MTTTLQDTPELRAARKAAYVAGRYTFTSPPVCPGGWDAQAWMNWVVFDDTTLTGFLPYVAARSIVDGVES